MRPYGHRVVVLAHRVPAQLGGELQRPRDGEPRTEVARTLPGKLETEALAVVVADDRRMNPVLPIRSYPEKRRPPRREGPLVQVAGVVRGADVLDVQRDHAGGVSAVDQHV